MVIVVSRSHAEYLSYSTRILLTEWDNKYSSANVERYSESCRVWLFGGLSGPIIGPNNQDNVTTQEPTVPSRLQTCLLQLEWYTTE
ncbi:hypothetical protein NPIL_625811 [Nephila pilipes]|uniref:Uncharacterized protein n=1 Tax=Nephila pilipes TaxID=299642 RepID=A0A8X6Q1G5_NEPPI|nr:hypothetical protein NPIL_625811 [Nephila pilipes]